MRGRIGVRGAVWMVASAAALAGCGPDRTAPVEIGRIAADTTSAPPGSRALRDVVQPLTGDARDYDALMAMIGDASVVLLGEESHGTHEFYAERARITQRLITEKGFNAVAIEGDWPAATRVHRYVRGGTADATADQALASFTRFPRWMWRNAVVRDLVQWLRTHNATAPERDRVGFHGLDVYSAFATANDVIAYLERVDPAAAIRARGRYQCVLPYADTPEAYGDAVVRGGGRSCETGVREQLEELERRVAEQGRAAGGRADEELLSAYQGARVVRNAERYYRAIYGGENSWNVRDRHMAETVDALTSYLDPATGRRTKVVVWAHNTHTGDERATEMGEGGQLNIGQLMRERRPGATANVGFTTYTGTVLAASDWGRPGEMRTVNPAIADSYGALFHTLGVPRFVLLLRGAGPLAPDLARPRLERAIGVVYAPLTERVSHYFTARLASQFDAVIHIDQTTAVRPLVPEGTAAARGR